MSGPDSGREKRRKAEDDEETGEREREREKRIKTNRTEGKQRHGTTQRTEKYKEMDKR